MVEPTSLLFYRSVNSRSALQGFVSGDVARKQWYSQTRDLSLQMQSSFTGALVLHLLGEEPWTQGSRTRTPSSRAGRTSAGGPRGPVAWAHCVVCTFFFRTFPVDGLDAVGSNGEVFKWEVIVSGMTRSQSLESFQLFADLVFRDPLFYYSCDASGPHISLDQKIIKWDSDINSVAKFKCFLCRYSELFCLSFRCVYLTTFCLLSLKRCFNVLYKQQTIRNEN